MTVKPPSEFVSYLLEQLHLMNGVTYKRMFGGYGIFCDGLMFGLVADDQFYLKADEQNLDYFTELSLEPFTYLKQGKPFNLSYYRAPEEVLDDAEEMLLWANRSFEAALRANAKKPKKTAKK